ncbi:hypothetical protein BH10PSE1_BH10PSE1_24440 [soil metagenome]
MASDPVDLDKTEKGPPASGRPLLIGAISLVIVIAIGSAFAQGNKAPPVSPEPVRPALALAAAPSGPQTAEGEWIEWKADDGARHYQAGDLAIDIATVPRDDLNAAKVTLTDADGARIDWTGDGTVWSAGARFALVRLDAADTRPQILLSSFSGGAHCCASLTLVRREGGQWRQTDLGVRDGDAPSLPKDLDGDGVKEFAFVDQAFLYAFASYAESWAPPVIKTVVSGQVRDVSDQRRFRQVFAADAVRAKETCLQNSNGACAAYVASAARTGALDEAWSTMLHAYDQASDWTLPTACRIRTSGSCPANAELTFGSFPEALQWFLGEHGYTSPVYVEPLHAAGPSFDCGGVTSVGEIAVCQDSSLATLDRTIAVVYTRALALSADRAALRSAQRTFQSTRNGLADPALLRPLYEGRINQLLAID